MLKTLIPILALSAVIVGCGTEPALIGQARKATLVHALLDNLHASVEAEKSAVMATTDEESITFAQESRRRTAEMNQLRDELHRRVLDDDRPGERSKLAAFDTAWAEVRDVDERLLALAVANSNLKAARLAAGESAVAVDRLVDALAQVAAQSSDPRVIREVAAASVSALRIQTLLAPHVATADDEEMTRLEARVSELGEQVEGVLAKVRNGAASAAWRDYQRLTADVMRLSRLNTNVVSVDVSVHEKRRVTESCRNALAALLHEIQTGPDATR